MSQHKYKILVADDVTENIDILLSILKDDYAIIVAKDGEKVLKLAQGESPPDLILLDVMMPNMDGYEACMRLKGDPKTQGIPIIFTTALNGVEDEERGLRLGAVDYVTKPFNPALLRARISNQLEFKKHQDHLQDLVDERTAELLRTQDATIYTLANLAETRDPETGGHIRRTQTYVKLLAEELHKSSEYSAQLDEETIELLYKSAPLHDIGKVGVADAILLKPGKLTDEEFDEMKRHAAYGRDALSAAVEQMGGSSFLKLAEEIAYT
ncbi:MAG: response regulator, partial [Chromatiales bacterium]|nr:response regulator [Chromatiales bacterium]